MNKKIKKIFLVFFTVLSMISFSCISASALTNVDFVSGRPILNDNSCYFEVVTDFGSCYVFYVSVSVTQITVSGEQDFDRFSVNFDTQFIDGSLWVYPVNILSLSDGLQVAIEGYEIFGNIIFQDGTCQAASYSSEVSSDGGAVGIYLGNNYRCLRSYNAECTNRGSDYVFVYANEININNKLDSILSGVQGGNQQIINSQNQNAQQIQQNQNENTDKVLNGWDSSGKSPDTTTTDDYHEKEQEVFNSTASARSSVVSMFNNFGSLLNDTPVQRGLLACSKIMTEFFSIGWIAGLVQFALTIGAFAFIIGSVIMVVGKVSSNNAASERRDKANESRILRNNYFKARTEYYNSRRKK